MAVRRWRRCMDGLSGRLYGPGRPWSSGSEPEGYSDEVVNRGVIASRAGHCVVIILFQVSKLLYCTLSYGKLVRSLSTVSYCTVHLHWWCRQSA